jgi:hypothetical protein
MKFTYTPEYVKSVLNNYKQTLNTIEQARSDIIEEISFLNENLYLEIVPSSACVGDGTAVSKTNVISDPTYKKMLRIEEKNYASLIDAQMRNLLYFQDMEDRTRRVKSVFTKMALLYPLHYLVVKETWLCNKTQDEIRKNIKCAKSTIRMMQTNITTVVTDICNTENSTEMINEMPPEKLNDLILKISSLETCVKMTKIEMESENNDNWD